MKEKEEKEVKELSQGRKGQKSKRVKHVKPLSFTDYMLVVIADLEAEERFGTAHVYRYALLSFTEFVGGGEVFFGGLTRRSLKLFENYLRDRLRSWNTVSTYARGLRAVYNRAVDDGLIPGEYRLFSGLFTGFKSGRKRALQACQMQMLLDASSPVGSDVPGIVCQSRDLLSLMLRLQGMPFTDLIHLHRADLHTDLCGHSVLDCRRQKTGTGLKVSVTAEALQLIDRYRSTDPSSPYLLRFFDGATTGEDIYREYCRQLRHLNRGLSMLPAYCGLRGVKVSSYTARHTWATLAKYCQVPEEVISEGLGHSSLEVTRTYLKSFEGDELEKANRIIIDYISTGMKNVWIRA